jgi:eukaryotic-like serine/threonine-protein kinase
MVGEVIGSYRIIRQLGEGGMGVVYLAEHTLIGKKAAVKVLLPEFSRNQDVVNRFFNEARAATMVKHPGMIDIYDFGQHSNGSAFIVMEFLEGESLATRLHGAGKLESRLISELGRQIASVLVAVHAKGIVHRDLKPDNIFLVPDSDVAIGERCKVLDFGIAKLQADTAPTSTKTRTGAIMGTPAYMSPEQCRGAGQVDHRSDVYALGCILFHMASGRPPFVGEGPGDVIAQHLYEPPPSLSGMVTPSLDATIRRSLAKKVDERFQTMAEMLAALDSATGRGARTPSQPVVSVAAAPASQPTTLSGAASEMRKRPSGGSLTRLAALGGTGVGIAILGTVWLLSRSSTPTPAPVAIAAPAAPKPAAELPAPPAPSPTAATAPEAKSPAPRPAATPPSEQVQLRIESQPAGATVRRGGKSLGKTPVTVEAMRDSGQLSYELSLDGYEPASVLIGTHEDGSGSAALIKREVASKPVKAQKPAPATKPAASAVSTPAPKPVGPKPAAPKPANKNAVVDPFAAE